METKWPIGDKEDKGQVGKDVHHHITGHQFAHPISFLQLAPPLLATCSPSLSFYLLVSPLFACIIVITSKMRYNC